MREDIVAAARGWIGTRFAHQGRLKKTTEHKGGVDCLGLLTGVAAELNLRLANGGAFIERDDLSYSHYPDTMRLRQTLADMMHEISTDTIEAGDVLLLSIDGNPQHLAIVSNFADEDAIIHAYAPARAVVEHAIDGWWKKKIVAAFRVI